MKKIGQRSSIIRKVTVFTILFITGILIFRDAIFFNKDVKWCHDIDENVMAGYQHVMEEYIPIDETATIVINNFEESVNELEMSFDEALGESTTFYLFNSSSNVEQFLIDSKTVRKGYKRVLFDFEKQNIDQIKILAKASDESHFVNIPTGNIALKDRHLGVNKNHIMSLLILLIIIVVAMRVAFYIDKEKCNLNESVDLSKKRDSNLELLRIICMFLLVAHHFAVHGGLLTLGLSIPKCIGLLFLPVGKICFLAYVAISMYFLCDGKSKFIRFIKCWAEVLFYSFSLTLLTWALGGEVYFKDFVSSLFVMISNSHGFAASYLLFLLIYPFILRATKNCTQKQARYILVVTFWVQIMSQVFKAWTGYTQPVFSELTLFVFCYFLSLNLKRYPIRRLDDWRFDLILVGIIYTYSLGLNVMACMGKLNPISSFLLTITADESSIFYIIGGYALFYLFKNISIPYNRAVNSVAAGTFGILLIHDHNFLRHIFWTDIVRTQVYFGTKEFVVVFILIIISIFFVCSVIDFVRRELLEKRLIRNTKVVEFSNKMDNVLNE